MGRRYPKHRVGSEQECRPPATISKGATVSKQPTCANCGKLNVYTLKDGTVVCRTCGHREVSDER